MSIRRAGFISALVVIGIFLACGQREDPDEFVRREVAELQKRTVPPGCDVLNQSAIQQNGWSKSVRWELETNWNWTQYEAWLNSQLQADFVIERPGEAHLLFIRTLHGDSEVLRVHAVSHRPKLRVKVEFVIRPD